MSNDSWQRRAGRHSMNWMRIWLIAGLVCLVGSIVPMQPAAAAGLRWDELDDDLSELAPESNLLVAEFQGSSCQTIHGRDTDDQLAIASTFKLYVLGELARQVQIGEVAWDERIPLRDELKSMPSGDYAYLPAGTMVSVEDLAAAMIQNSDNTATDHLIDFLGRENVERAFAAFGHDDPDRNLPLLMTRELFAIKMRQSAQWMSEFMTANDDTQRNMLVQQIDPMMLDPYGGWGNWNGPTAIDGIEWFASADDLCRLTAALWTMGSQPDLEPVRDILAGNRGGVGDVLTWPRAGYKGGYEAGVVNMTFVLERHDGRVFFVTADYNHPNRVVDQWAARSYLDPVFECLGARSAGESCVADD